MGKKAVTSSQRPKMDKFTVASQKDKHSHHGHSPEIPEPDELAEILTAIQASRIAFESQIGGVQLEVSLVRQDLRNVVDRVAEGRVSELEDTVKELKATVHRLSSTTGALEARAEGAENSARRNNLRFVGFAEGIEGVATETFLEDWIRSWVPSGSLSTCFVVERAHQSLVKRPPEGTQSRPLTAKILNHKNRHTILRQAREMGDLNYENSKMIFPDYTLQVQKAQRTFEAVKQKRRTMGLTYINRFPAKLKVLHAGKSNFFSTTQEAWDWATENHTLRSNLGPPWGSTDAPTDSESRGSVRRRRWRSVGGDAPSHSLKTRHSLLMRRS